MTEYPHVGTWPTVLLGWLTGENITAFYIGFTIMTLLVDAAFLALTAWIIKRPFTKFALHP